MSRSVHCLATAQMEGIEPLGFGCTQLFGERKESSPPASGSSSYLRSPPSHNPSPRFHLCVHCVAFATTFCIFVRVDAHPLVMDALAEMSEAQNTYVLAPPTVRALPPHGMRKCGGNSHNYFGSHLDKSWSYISIASFLFSNS